MTDERLFPPSINDDPLLLFHGTTSSFAESIEANGFLWMPDTISRDEIRMICDVYVRMGWAGIQGEGYAGLSTFSLQHDFANGPTKPTYFHLEPERAMLYSDISRAGGESACLALCAIDDLHTFLADKDVRAEFRRTRWRNLQIAGCNLPTRFSLVESEKATSDDCRALLDWYRLQPFCRSEWPLFNQRPWDDDLSWLSAQVTALHPIEQRLHCLRGRHEFGVVYAVRPQQADAATIDAANVHIEWRGRIPANRIVAKALLPRDQQHYFRSTPREIDDHLSALRLFVGGRSSAAGSVIQELP